MAPGAPVITGPKVDVSQSSTAVLLQGTATPGTVRIFDGATLLASLPYDGGQWTFSTVDLSEGPHVFTAHTVDAAGNVSGPSAPRTVTVDRVAPTVTIDSNPGPLTNLFTFDIAFSASEPGVTFECLHFWPGTPDPDVSQCTSPWAFRELPDGVHRFELTATDATGNRGPTVGRDVTIDSAVPTPIVPTFEGTTFSFAAEEPGATFECRVEGPAVDSGFVPCQSPKAYADLPGGDYRFTLRTLDAAGNYADATRARSPSPQTPQIDPTPTPSAAPTPRPTATPTPTPEVRGDRRRPARQRQDPRACAGHQRVRRARRDEGPPGRYGDRCPQRQDPADLRAGPGQAGPEGRASTAASSPSPRAATASSSSGSPRRSPHAPRRRKKAKAAAAKPKSRKLWGDGKGKFRTRGQYSAATIRGTRWLVEDSCKGTLTRVTNGVVSVRDNGARKTVLVRAGKSYLAKPKR